MESRECSQQAAEPNRLTRSPNVRHGPCQYYIACSTGREADREGSLHPAIVIKNLSVYSGTPSRSRILAPWNFHRSGHCNWSGSAGRSSNSRLLLGLGSSCSRRTPSCRALSQLARSLSDSALHAFRRFACGRIIFNPRAFGSSRGDAHGPRWQIVR